MAPRHSLPKSKPTKRFSGNVLKNSFSGIRTGLYCGPLNLAEVDAGFGMGMAVATGPGGLRRSFQCLSRSNSNNHV
jgi:hypothetical protein